MESAIFKLDLTNVEDHESQWNKLLRSNEGLQKILAVVDKPGKALVFSHDDPDGITSGLIFKRLLQKKGWQVVHKMPEGFILQATQFEAALKEMPDADAVFCLDKGTQTPYDAFATDERPLYIIDHHPTPVPPQKCVFFNPAVPSYVQCSGSILAHGISVLAGTREQYDDLLALIGLKGDWAIEPVSGFCADFVKPFLKTYGKPFEGLMKTVEERPTMFDSTQRSCTCLLSRISEYVHGCGGGGFSYFYNDRDEALKDVNHPECVAKALEAVSDKTEDVLAVKSLDEFTAMLPEPQKGLLAKIWNFFLEDWNNAAAMLDSSARILKLEDTSIYLFVGPKVPLLPMIGSIKLFDLKDAGHDKLAQIIMVSAVSDEYTHVSVRATGPRVHSGKFCTEMQDSLKAKYPDAAQFVSGGGHPVAAECTVKTDKISFLNVLTRVTEVLSEMKKLDDQASKGKLNSEDKARAAKLGLEYLN